MTTENLIFDLDMLTGQVKPITLEVRDLQEDEHVTGATVTHTPPSGDALTITPSIETPYVNMLFGPFAVAGYHHVKVQAQGSNGSKPEVLFQVRVL